MNCIRRPCRQGLDQAQGGFDGRGDQEGRESAPGSAKLEGIGAGISGIKPGLPPLFATTTHPPISPDNFLYFSPQRKYKLSRIFSPVDQLEPLRKTTGCHPPQKLIPGRPRRTGDSKKPAAKETASGMSQILQRPTFNWALSWRASRFPPEQD
jgi:hypothetical protein